MGRRRSGPALGMAKGKAKMKTLALVNNKGETKGDVIVVD